MGYGMIIGGIALIIKGVFDLKYWTYIQGSDNDTDKNKGSDGHVVQVGELVMIVNTR
jgi:hypothetical protein